MSRGWTYFRIPGTNPGMPTEQAISEVVPPLVEHLHAADPDGRWFFQRPAAEQAFGIGFHATEPVLDELERLIEVESTKHDLPALAQYLDGRSAEIARELSSASSEFALDLLRLADLDDAHEQLATAVRHLCCLVGLTPESDRHSFLFLSWEQAAGRLLPEQRLAVARRAEGEATPIVRDAAGTADVTEERVWQRYLATVREITDECRTDGELPTNYLLFEHTHLTHDRLGIPAETEALAAQVTRTALRGGDTPVDPDLMVRRPSRDVIA